VNYRGLKPPLQAASNTSAPTKSGSSSSSPRQFGPGSRPALHAWKLTLEYDGSRYSGWAEQENAPRTILGELRKAAEALYEGAVELGGAGRTDAGVHATGQVAHLKVELRGAPPPVEKLLLALNEELPFDIAVRSIEEVPSRFHARHDAIARTYVYRIARRKDAFSKKFVWWVKEPLDLRLMREAVELLPGRHDFVLFRAEDPSRPDESTIVEVKSATLEEQDRLLLFRMEASHFIWRMVRRVTGAVVKVGLHELNVDQFRRLLNAEPIRGIEIAEWTAPSSGLFLDKVTYPESRPRTASASRPSASTAGDRERPTRATPRGRAPRR
jgi:tRNA pseudouridine38-40 synthase